jgi:hypothetical protein
MPIRFIASNYVDSEDGEPIRQATANGVARPSITLLVSQPPCDILDASFAKQFLLNAQEVRSHVVNDRATPSMAHELLIARFDLIPITHVEVQSWH